jgi:hypothetical protein
MRMGILAALSLLASAIGADAKVLTKGPTGFVVEHKVELAADARKAYDAFVNVGAWWSSDHSFSGDAANMTVDASPGGCWCEKLPDGGGVKHMEVIHANPGEMLVFAGGLGPLQFMGVAGSMTVSFANNAGKTTVTLHYDVGGRDDKGFAEISAAVDGVLAEQVARYAAFVNTGKP